jgi:hypothetical protein
MILLALTTWYCISAHPCFHKHMWITSSSVSILQRWQPNIWHLEQRSSWLYINLTLARVQYPHLFHLTAVALSQLWMLLIIYRGLYLLLSVVSANYLYFTFLKALPGANIQNSLFGPRFLIWGGKFSFLNAFENSKRYGCTESVSIGG